MKKIHKINALFAKAPMALFALFCFIYLAGCDTDPNCEGFAGPPTEELLAQFGGVVTDFGNELSSNNGDFYHFKAVNKFGEQSSHGLVTSILRESISGTNAKLSIDGNELVHFSAVDGSSVSSANKSALITQAFGGQHAITQYMNENSQLFSRNFTFPQEMIVTSPNHSSLNMSFARNASISWVAGSNSQESVYIVLIATSKWPINNPSLITPIYKVIKTSDTGNYQFQSSDFSGFPSGIKFAMYVSRGNFSSFSSGGNSPKRLIVATSSSRGLFTLVDGH